MEESLRVSGMRDMLPPQMARFRRIEDAFRNVCLGWGYEEVRTPTIEHLHLFTSAGTLSPRMLGRVYSFLDWDGWRGERVVLRPDSTIPVARLYAEAGDLGSIRKYFYVQSVLRFAQGDDSREDWQCGVELIGDSQPLGDVELVLLATEVLTSLGLDPEIKLSDPGIVRAILLKAGYALPEQLALYDRMLDGDLAVLHEVAARIPGLSASLSAMLSIEGEGAPYIENLRAALSPAIPEVSKPLSELGAVSETLAALKRTHTVAPLLVRDFEYYTGPVFHFYHQGAKLGGGGRYDALIGLVGGSDVPASGLALEMETIASVLPEAPFRAATEVSIRPRGAARGDVAAAFTLAAALRRSGRACRLAAMLPGKDEAAACQVLAAADGYELRLNGREPRSFAEADEVLRALADAGL